MADDPALLAMSILQIIWIDIVLSGDNAVVIALACRNLPPRQKTWGIVLGAGTAIILRILFASIVITLLEIPYLRAIGAVLLFWIAIKLVLPEAEEAGDERNSADTLWRAVVTIAIADAAMSLDNVIALAAASHGSIILLSFGILLSIPLLVAGSALVMGMFERYPFLVWAGAALLGWISGHLLATDLAARSLVSRLPGDGVLMLSIAGLLFVIGCAALILRLRQQPILLTAARPAEPPNDEAA